MKTTKFYQIARLMILSGLFFFSAQSFAQETFEVKGRILNTLKQPVKNASATLLDATTMEQVAGTICDENGVFIFGEVKQGEYILSVAKDGFTRTESRRILIDNNGKYIQKGIVMNDSKQKTPELIAAQ